MISYTYFRMGLSDLYYEIILGVLKTIGFFLLVFNGLVCLLGKDLKSLAEYLKTITLV